MKLFTIRMDSMLLLATAVLWLYGCAAAAPADPVVEKLPVEVLWTSNQSNHTLSRPLALWVTDANRLDVLAKANPVRAAEAVLKQRQVDWHRENVFWLNMGHKTSGGYALSLAAPEARVANGAAIITVQWRKPRPGAIVTQQLTSPCLVLKLPKGNYHKIIIRDESGRERIRAEVGIKQ